MGKVLSNSLERVEPIRRLEKSPEIVVTSSADLIENDGVISLREAVLLANAAAGPDAIAFDPTVFDGEAPDVIRLTLGQIEVTESLTISGGPAGVTITGDRLGDDVTIEGGITDVEASLDGEDRLDDNSRIFDVLAGDLTVDGLTLTGGRTTAVNERGGAIRAAGAVTVADAVIAGNSTAGDLSSGGGVYTAAALTVSDSFVSGNRVARYASGGGLYGADSVVMTRVSIAANTADGAGGVFGRVVDLTESVVSDNASLAQFSLPEGGGIVGDDVTVTDSIVSGNRGGGVRGTTVRVSESAILDNSAIASSGYSTSGGGVYGRSTVTLTNSIVSGNSVESLYAYAFGGGVDGRDVTIIGSTIASNRVMAYRSGGGGGVYGATVRVIDSTIAANSLETYGGAPEFGYTGGGGGIGGVSVSVSNSAVIRNVAAGFDVGGGLAAFTLSVTNSTISDNSAARAGGGLYSLDLSLVNSTVSGNTTAGDGGALFSPERSSFLEGGLEVFGTVRIKDSILLGNSSAAAGPDQQELGGDATVALLGGNIVGADVLRDSTVVGATDAAAVFAETVESAPGVLSGRLADNGGPVATIALRNDPSNPAFDASGEAAQTTDARGRFAVDLPGLGAAAPSRGVRDLGAYETPAPETPAPETPSLIVTTALDVVDAFDGVTSLREAVALANATPGLDMVTFNEAVFDGGAEDLIRLSLGQITVRDDLAITGGSAGVTITGDARGDDVTIGGGITDVAASLASEGRLDDNSRLFEARGSLTIEALTLTGGRTRGEYEVGGAVRASTLTLVGSTIAGNSTAGANGGGLWGSTVTLTNSTVFGNSAAGSGGGLSGGDVTLTNSTVAGNSAARSGGGLSGRSVTSVTLKDSILLGNSSATADAGQQELGGYAPVALLGGNIVGSNVFRDSIVVGATDAAAVFAETVESAPGVLSGRLADNGGPVATIALRDDPSNPALDASGEAAQTTDARGRSAVDLPGIGAAAPSRGVRDLGAYETRAAETAAPETPSLIVTTALDVVDAFDGVTSLREAIAFANATPGLDMVTFDEAVFDGGAEDLIRLSLGQITVRDELIIRGGPAGVTITGDALGDDVTIEGGITDVAASRAGEDRLDDNSRIFEARGDVDFAIDSLTLTGGSARDGGAILAQSLSELTVENSTIAGNLASAGSGGGVAVVDSSSLVLRNTTVSGNVAGPLNNPNPAGGGVFIARSLATIENSTFVDNVASRGGGIASLDSNATLTSSIMAENVGGDLLGFSFGTIASGGANLIGDGSGGGAFVNGVNGDVVGTAMNPIDPRLGPLTLNGGPTATHALLVGSPAIDAGANPLSLETDQRGEGFPREVGAAPDIGAFEIAAPLLPVFVETDKNSLFRVRDTFTAPDGGEITAALRPDGADRDFFEFRGLTPGQAVVVEVTDGAFDSTLGLFDQRGHLFAVDNDDGADGLSRLGATADEHGAVRVAVSGFDDLDFDGKSDTTGQPHGQTGDYKLAATIATQSRTVVARSADDAEQDGPSWGVQLKGTVLTTGDRPGKAVGVRFEGFDTQEGAEIVDAYIRFHASSRIQEGGALTIALEDSQAAVPFGWFGAEKILGRDYLDDTVLWTTEAVRFGDAFRTPNLAPLLDELLGGDNIGPDDAFAFRIAGPGRIDAWSFDGKGSEPELVIVYADPPPPESFDLFGLG